MLAQTERSTFLLLTVKVVAFAICAQKIFGACVERPRSLTSMGSR